MTTSDLRPIPGHPHYFASIDGRIWSAKRKGGNARAAGQTGEPRPLTPVVRRHGYLAVNLDSGGKNVSRMVHALVLEAFVGPAPEGMEACHYPDPDPANNAVSNLRWDTHAENAKDKYRDRPPVTRKVCRRCGAEKPASDFYGDSRASDGLKTECKACHIATAKATRDPEKHRTRNREYMKQLRSAR